ncbi:unnamed protein product, partial [Effrenium voratum]
VIGRFGIFDMEPLKGNTQAESDVLCSFFLMVFVEEAEQRETGTELDQAYRDKYARWREEH